MKHRRAMRPSALNAFVPLLFLLVACPARARVVPETPAGHGLASFAHEVSRGDRLLFAQDQGERSGEIFLIDLAPQPDRAWPPRGGDVPVSPGS